jgi:hypothetical protein
VIGWLFLSGPSSLVRKSLFPFSSVVCAPAFARRGFPLKRRGSRKAPRPAANPTTGRDLSQRTAAISASRSTEFTIRTSYGAAFAHTTTRGLVVAPLGQVTVVSLTKVADLLRGPQYATVRTSSSLHSPLHVAAWQSARMIRTAPSLVAAATPDDPGGPCAP